MISTEELLDVSDQLGEEGKNNHELEKAKRIVEQDKVQLVVRIL